MKLTINSLISKINNIYICTLVGFLYANWDVKCQVNNTQRTSTYKEFNVQKEYIKLQNKQIDKGCLDSLTFMYNGTLVTYGIVKVNGRLWLDRNLGAKKIPLHKFDTEGFGDYFQWGRKADGHQLKDTVYYKQVELEKSQPGNSGFILSSDSTVIL